MSGKHLHLRRNGSPTPGLHSAPPTPCLSARHNWTQCSRKKCERDRASTCSSPMGAGSRKRSGASAAVGSSDGGRASPRKGSGQPPSGVNQRWAGVGCSTSALSSASVGPGFFFPNWERIRSNTEAMAGAMAGVA
eukprot:scaffold27418_cov79-Isochrysis_galbana.AAC.1